MALATLKMVTLDSTDARRDAAFWSAVLGWDVAAVEDEFDIIITMNRAAEIETVGALIDAVGELEG